MGRDVTFALRNAKGQFAVQDHQVSVEIDYAPMVARLDAAGAAVDQFQLAMLERLVENLSEESPVDEGRLRDGWRVHGDTVVSLWEHALWVTEGTGIYGPSGSRIFPVTAQALRFEIDGQVVFAASVAGSPANPFHEKAKDRTAEQAEEILAALIAEVA